jgi:hypothetical protein
MTLASAASEGAHLRPLLPLALVAIACDLGFIACASPVDDEAHAQTLRDVLVSDPDPPSNEQRRVVREHEDDAAEEEHVIIIGHDRRPDEVVARIDDDRRAHHEDAIDVAVLERHDDEVVVHPLRSRDPEEAKRISGATRVEIVRGWPAGVVVLDDVVYVNRTWLDAMERETSGDLAPRALTGNPYSRPATIARCAEGVRARCSSCVTSGRCEEGPTLDGEADERAECEVLLAERSGPEELCVIAFTSIESVHECISGCPNVPAGHDRASLGVAGEFLKNDACVAKLNVCVSGRDDSKASSTMGTSGSGCSGGGGCSNGSGCSNSSGGCSGGGGGGGCQTAPHDRTSVLFVLAPLFVFFRRRNRKDIDR